MTANEYKVLFQGDENVLELDSDYSSITLNILKTPKLYTYKNKQTRE